MELSRDDITKDLEQSGIYDPQRRDSDNIERLIDYIAELSEQNEGLGEDLMSANDLISAKSAKIKELTEKNKKLSAQNYMLCPDGRLEMIPTVESVRADTVREMQERLKMYFGTYTLGYKIPLNEVLKVINQIAKEMLEGGE